MAYRASDLAFQSSFNTSRDWQPPRHPYAPQNPYNPSGIWQGGGGLVADRDGNVYTLVGNGATDLPNGNYGDTFLKLTPTGSSLVPTAFVPADAAAMAANDADLGGGGNLAIPGTDFVIGGGKPGFMYLMNRDSMALRQQFTASTNQYDHTQRDQTWDRGPHLHGSPTYWRGPDRTFGNLYAWGEKDYLRLFHFDTVTGKVITPEFKKAPVLALVDTMPGGMISISSNGNRAGTGILWATLPTDVTPNPYPGRLYAFNAETLQPLWDTDFPSFGHWLLPTIADGKVFVGTSSDQIICYELGDERGHNTSWKPYQPHDIASLAATVHSTLHPTEAVMTTIPQNTLLALSPPAGALKFATLTGKGKVSFSANRYQKEKISRWQEAGIAIEGTANIDEKQGPKTIKLEISPKLVFTASDGSIAEARAIKTFTAPEDDSALWELYEVVRSSGSGLLTDVTYIQRVHTQGGLPPMHAERSKSLTTSVPFEAEYIFYRNAP
jgi:outer membrane protein assembly factor BamB